MNCYELAYNALVARTIISGKIRSTRAGPTLSTFGTILKIDCLSRGEFPILTQRKIFLGGVLGELAAFLRGATDLKTFKDFGCNYWDANAEAWLRNKHATIGNMQVGKIYGYQWRKWDGYVDQLAELVTNLRTNPDSRRHLLTTYNPSEQHTACLPPCHITAQFNSKDKVLDCCVYMRSVDLCLGLPSDVALYAALMLVICGQTDHTPGELTFMMGDTHVYMNQVDTYQTHAERESFPLPQYSLLPTTIDTFVPADLKLINYQNAGVLQYAFSA